MADVNGRQIPIPHWKSGDHINAKDLNALADTIRAMNTGSGQNSQTVVDPVAPLIEAFKVIGQTNDYLICVTWDGTTLGSTNIYVCKPYRLQASTLDGTTDANGIAYAFTGVDTLTATRASDSTTENWQITETYHVGDVIFGIANVRDGVDTVGPTGLQLDWLDINVDGRAWAKV